MKHLLLALLLLGLGAASPGEAGTFIGGHFGGFPLGVTNGATYALGTGSVRADHRNGQTFVTWPDAASDVASVPCPTGTAVSTNQDAPGAAYRYRMYRATYPLNSGNYATGSLIGNYIFYNSAQMFGGNPDTAGGQSFIPAHRQCNDTNNPMAKIPDEQAGGSSLWQPAFGSGLQVYTPLANGNSYYAVVSTDTSDGNPAFIGSVGPISETVATPQPIPWAHRTTLYGHVTITQGAVSNKPVVVSLHASSSNGGAAGTTSSNEGDYFLVWGTTSHGYRDGMPSALDVQQDGSSGTNFPGLPGALVLKPRDTVWNTVETLAMETDWFGLGVIPNPLVPTIGAVGNGRHYPFTYNRLVSSIQWIGSSGSGTAGYGADLTRVHLTGESMGAIGGVIDATRMTSPRPASDWAMHPLFRLDLWGSSVWAGVTWGGTLASPWPYSATVSPGAPSTLGTVNTAVLESDNTSWFNNYVDVASIWAAHPGTDYPFFGITDSFGDVNLSASAPGDWHQILTGINALQNAHHPHAFVFYHGAHWTSSGADGAIDADSGSGTNANATAYTKSSFTNNQPYPAFDHSTDNDNPGTGTHDPTTGMYDGDYLGCMECGHTWSITSDTTGGVTFTVGDNGWMGLSPTTLPSSTLASSIASTGSGTFTIASSSGFLGTASVNKNAAFLIGSGSSTELLYGDINLSTGVITIQPGSRGREGTTSQAHSIGDAIVQLPSKPTGPMHGPFASINSTVTLRQLVNFKPTEGSTVKCFITPNGGTQVEQDIIVTNGLFPILGTGPSPMLINASGPTSVNCHP